MSDWEVTSFKLQKMIADRHRDAGFSVDSSEVIRRKLWTLTHFFQTHSLTNRMLAESRDQINKSFAIHTTDLTDEGIAFVRTMVPENWEVKTKSPEDTSILDKGFKKFKESPSPKLLPKSSKVKSPTTASSRKETFKKEEAEP